MLWRLRCNTRYGLSAHKVAKGDAFMLLNQPGEGVRVMFLNPPYDTDRQHKRLKSGGFSASRRSSSSGACCCTSCPSYALGASARPSRGTSIAWRVSACLRPTSTRSNKSCSLAASEWARHAGSVHRRAGARVERRVLHPGATGRKTSGFPSDPYESADCVSGAHRLHVASCARALMGDAHDRPHRDARELSAVDVHRSRRTAPGHAERRAGRGPTPGIMVPRLRLACPPRPAHIAMAAGAGRCSPERLTPTRGSAGRSFS